MSTDIFIGRRVMSYQKRSILYTTFGTSVIASCVIGILISFFISVFSSHHIYVVSFGAPSCVRPRKTVPAFRSGPPSIKKYITKNRRRKPSSSAGRSDPFPVRFRAVRRFACHGSVHYAIVIGSKRQAAFLFFWADKVLKETIARTTASTTRTQAMPPWM